MKQLEAITSRLEYPVKTKAGFDRLVMMDTLIVKKTKEAELKKQYSYLLKYEESALQWAQKEGSLEDVLQAKLMLARFHEKLANTIKAIKLGEELLNYEKELRPNQMADVVFLVANAYAKMEAYNEVLALEPLAKKYYTVENGYAKRGYTSAERIGMTYYSLRQYQKAATNFRKQADAYRLSGNQLMVSSMYHNVGLSYFKLKEFEKARKYYDTALVELKKPNGFGYVSTQTEGYNNYFQKIIEGNIGQLYFEIGDYEVALPYFLEEMKAATTSKNIRESRIITKSYYNLAKLYFYKGEVDQAKYYLYLAFDTIDQFDDTESIILLYELRGKIFLRQNKAIEANKAFDRAKDISDSLEKQRLQRQNLIALSKYDVDVIESELETSQREGRLTEKVANNQLIALVIFGISLILISFFLLKTNRDKKTIATQKTNLESSLKEKEILLKEVHHRVKNNLQVISGLLQLQTKKADTPAMHKVLEDSQRQIHSMALVHQMLHQQDKYSCIPMKNYLEKLVGQLLYSLPGKNVKTQVNVAPINLGIDAAIPLGLLLSELMTNTSKYAFGPKGGHIKVALQAADQTNLQANEYIFTYADDGVGLAKDYEKKFSETMGFRLILMLTEEMGGTIDINGDNGVCVTVKFKDT
ncbi:tetratricopeptide repeat-containing sensor histidine kinase [Rasiella sp. SM2506]|uniref:tetratricopeptide repeat-containing sensor histidine kinase n=1 Tax=Rasiella sp. SM2506 TaxID=3423914 RepID=UPI003D7BFF8E